MAGIKIPLEDIESTSLSGIGYEGEKLILAIRFKAGHIFHYASVPFDVAAGLGAAESKGRYYADNIKGKFSGAKMTGMCPKCGDGPGWLEETCADCGTAVYSEKTQEPKA